MTHLTHVLKLMAYHMATIETDEVSRGATRHGGCGIHAGDGPNPLTAYVEYRISGTGGDDPRWDRCQVYGLAGWLWVGNRAGLRNYVAEQYAPIIAEAARLDASEPAARAA